MIKELVMAFYKEGYIEEDGHNFWAQRHLVECDGEGHLVHMFRFADGENAIEINVKVINGPNRTT